MRSEPRGLNLRKEIRYFVERRTQQSLKEPTPTRCDDDDDVIIIIIIIFLNNNINNRTQEGKYYY